jgi:hypothetical protein
VDQRPDRPDLRAVGGSSDLPVRLVALAIVLLAVAIVKPRDWFASSSASGSARPVASHSSGVHAVAPTAAPTPTPTLPPGAIECNQPIGWRLALLTLETDRTTKTWIVADPASATSPADPVLLPLVVPADQIVRLGFCADHQAPNTAAARIVAAWQLDVSGSWSPILLDPGASTDTDGGTAVTYVPPGTRPIPTAGASGGSGKSGASLGGGRPWPTGDYVFKVTRGVTSAWFRVQLIWPPRYVGPTPGPSVAPTPSTTPAGRG